MKMFVARIATLDLKSVDSVLKGALCKVILTIRRKNTLKRIPSCSRDVYEEPTVRYRNHLIPDSPDCHLASAIYCPFKLCRNEIRRRRPVLRYELRSAYRRALGGLCCRGPA